MDLKFSFDAKTPLPLVSEGAGSASSPGAGVLTLRVSLSPAGDELVCEGLSGDGVSYARSQKMLSVDNSSPEGLAAFTSAVRSVLARGGAELPEPLIGSITTIELSLLGREVEVLTELGLTVSPGAQVLAQVNEALQARTGIAAGTPIQAA